MEYSSVPPDSHAALAFARTSPVTLPIAANVEMWYVPTLPHFGEFGVGPRLQSALVFLGACMLFRGVHRREE